MHPPTGPKLVRKHGHFPRTRDGRQRLISRLTAYAPEKVAAAEAKRQRRTDRNKRVLERAMARQAAEEDERAKAVNRLMAQIDSAMRECGFERAI